MNDKSLKAAVLGYPIAHSLSPVLHGKALKFLGSPALMKLLKLKVEGYQSFLRVKGKVTTIYLSPCL